MGKLNVEVIETKKVDLIYADCLQCGSNEIKFYKADTHTETGGECSHCGAKHVMVTDVDVGWMETINIWNEKNDINLLIKRANEIIKVEKEFVTRLKQKKKQRETDKQLVVAFNGTE